MGHTWRAEIIREDGSRISCADGDDVVVTQVVRMLAEPLVSFERNYPRKAVLELATSVVATRNVRSDAFALWSDGSPGAVKRGMRVCVWHVDAGTLDEVKTFEGRVRRIDREGDRVVLTAYDNLMELAEIREPATFFHSARDRMGDNTFAAPPDIPISFNLHGQITATLPDEEIVQPFMRLALAEPQNMYTGAFDGERSTSLGMMHYGHVVTIEVNHREFYRLRLRYRSTATVNGYAVVMGTEWNGTYYVPGGSRRSRAVTLPNTGGEYIEYETPPLPIRLTKGDVYAFGFEFDGGSDGLEPALAAEGMIPESWGEYYRDADGTWRFINAPYDPLQLNLQFLVEREIPSDMYRLDGKALVVAQGNTSIKRSDLAYYDRHLRISYFYGNLSPDEIMERLVEHGGMTVARAGGLTRGQANIGYYHTSTRSYLDCLCELADMWEPIQGHQWTVSADMWEPLDDRVVRIGRRRQPWTEPIDTHVYADGPLTSGRKRLLGSRLRETFEAKVATVRVLGQAFDGSPVSAQVDDRLWGDESLIEQIGAELMDQVVDSAVTTSARAVQVGEAIIRGQHQTAREGDLHLSGRWPSLWDQDPASDGCGGSRIFGLSVERDGLSAAPALARRIEIGGGSTRLDLDNVRSPDQSMIRRAMDKAMASEGFAVASMPNIVHIAANMGEFPPQIMTDGIARVKLVRTNGGIFEDIYAGTRIIRNDDHCAPDARGYTHFAIYIPPHTYLGPTSYHYGTYDVYPYHMLSVHAPDDTYALTYIRPVWIWSHQGVLIDVYGRRPA